MTEKPTLLPLNGVLPHNQYSLRIIKRLAAGLTGEVYQGELVEENSQPIPVAVKAMKPLEFQAARQLFDKEGETLMLMMGYEEAANREQRLSLKVAPLYYGRGDYEGTPYLVMEFIHGRGVPALLREQSRLPESQALTIAWHLYRTLDVMHIQLKKSYIDLKFENLWWVNDSDGVEGGQLKLTDFGTLEDIRRDDVQQRGVRRDLLLAGVYLLTMLTGYTLRYSLGRLLEPAEPILRVESTRETTAAQAAKLLAQQLEQGRIEKAVIEEAIRILHRATAEQAGIGVSRGTRRLLRRLLQRNPELRPTQAAGVAEELHDLVGFWTQPIEECFEIAQTNLSEAEGLGARNAEAVGFANRALAVLDIVRRRTSDEERLIVVQDMLRRAEEIGDDLKRGRGLFLGGSHSLARKTFEDGRHWSDEPAFFRRWAYLSRIGEEVSLSAIDEHRKLLFEALDWLNKRRWVTAAECLNTLPALLASTGLTALKIEAQLFGWLDRADAAARAGRYADAARANHEAEAVLSQLPDASAAREEVGDLAQTAREMQAWADTLQAGQSKIDEARQVLESGEVDRFDYAAALAEQAIDLQPKESDWRGVHQLAQSLSNAGRSLARSDQHTFADALRKILATAAFRSLPVLPPARALMNRAENNARTAWHFDLLRQLAELVEAAPIGDAEWAARLRHDADEIQTAERERRCRVVDSHMMAATYLLNIAEMKPARDLEAQEQGRELSRRFPDIRSQLIEAVRLLENAAALARGEYLAKEIARLQTRVNDLMEVLDLKTSVDVPALVRQGLQQRWAQLKPLIQQGDPAVQLLLIEFISDCQKWRHDPVIDALRELAESALNSLGVVGWESLRKTAEEKQGAIFLDFLEAQTVFAQGQPERAAELMRANPQYNSEPEWQQLKERLAQVEHWQAWQVSNAAVLHEAQPDPALLQTLRIHLQDGLPAVYWSKSLGSAYLEQARTVAWQAFRRPASADFVDRLRALLDVEVTGRLARWVVADRPDRNVLETVRQFSHLGRSTPAEAARVQAVSQSERERAWQLVKRSAARYRQPEFIHHLRALLEADWTARLVTRNETTGG